MRDEDGFVTVAVAGLLVALVSLAALLGCLAAVAVARHRAAAAADLAALAGAAHALEGEQVACGTARHVALAQGARLERCSLTGSELALVVSLRPAGRLGELGLVRARARAGLQPGTRRP